MNFLIIICIMFCPQKFVNSRNTFDFNSEKFNVNDAVSYLNSLEGRTWTAGKNSFGEYVTHKKLRSRLGVLEKSIKNNLESDILVGSNVYEYEDLPEFYDAREMYPHCSSISHIRDQSNCGSCWAVATASAFSDRLCIHSDGIINVEASINNLLGCELNTSLGCNGGDEEAAWEHIRKYGIVTGGDFNSEGCQPYSLRPCDGPNDLPCSTENALTPKCVGNECTNEWHKYDYEKPFKTSVTRRLPANETYIREDLYRNGPLTTAFKVYSPFKFYKKGVFKLDNPDNYPYEGMHAVRLIGWGTENKIPYWLLANSWGEEWGDKGTVKFFRGKNHCDIESSVCGGIPIIG